MLSEKRIAKLNAPGRYKAGEVRGLCLQVTAAGSKSCYCAIKFRAVSVGWALGRPVARQNFK